MATVPADLEQVTTLPTTGITSGQTTGHIADHIKISRALQAVNAGWSVLSVAGHAHAVADLTDTTDITRTFMKSATVAAARTAIGAQPVGDYATLVSGKIPAAQLPSVTTTAASISDATSTGRSLVTAADATTARGLINAQPAGSYATLEDGKVPTAQLPASAGGGVTIIEQAAYDALSPADQANGIYAILPPNLAAAANTALAEGSTTPFSVVGGGATLTAVTVSGVPALRVASSSSATNATGFSFRVPVSAGSRYRFDVTLQKVTGWSTPLRQRVQWLDSAGTLISTDLGTSETLPALVNVDQSRSHRTAAAPSGAVTADVVVRSDGNTPSSSAVMNARAFSFRVA